MNESVLDIRKVSGHEWVLALLAFLAVVGPGFLTVYQFHPELVKDLDLGKLILFSISLGGPSLFLEMSLVFLFAPENKRFILTPKRGLGFGAIGSSLAMYPSLLAVHLLHLNFHSYLIIVAFLVILYPVIIRFALKQAPDTLTKKPVI